MGSPHLCCPHTGRAVDLSPSSIVEARWWSGHIRRTARRPLRWARRVWGPSRNCWMARGTQSGLQQAHHVSKFLAKLRHFSVETGNLLKTHQIVSQVPQQSSPSEARSPPQFTKCFHIHSLLKATLRRRRQDRGYFCLDVNTPASFQKRIWDDSYCYYHPRTPAPHTQL